MSSVGDCQRRGDGAGCPVANGRGGGAGGDQPPAGTAAAADGGGGGGWLRGILGRNRTSAAAAAEAASTVGLGINEKSLRSSAGAGARVEREVSTASGDVGGGGGCPVRHGDGGSGSGSRRQQQPHPFGLPGSSSGGGSAATPASIEEAARHPQSARPGQSVPLDTRRVVSSIPRADHLRPEPPSKPPATPSTSDEVGCAGRSAPHQPPKSSKWVYPSEQQFYNATVRKGWSVPPESIPAVVRIHNAVNERGWSEVRRWERELHDNPNPRLVKFEGRPDHTSPRAWFNENVLGRRPPFDRHDWYVDRGSGSGGGEENNSSNLRRYVIDFYDGNPATSAPDPDSSTSTSAGKVQPKVGHGGARAPVSMYLDVRPALDDPGAFYDRARMAVREALPGIFGGGGGGGDDYGGGYRSGGGGSGGVGRPGGGGRE